VVAAWTEAGVAAAANDCVRAGGAATVAGAEILCVSCGGAIDLLATGDWAGSATTLAAGAALKLAEDVEELTAAATEGAETGVVAVTLESVDDAEGNPDTREPNCSSILPLCGGVAGIVTACLDSETDVESAVGR